MESGNAAPAVEWKFQQVLTGRTQEELTEGDLVSASEFDDTGNYLAFGNKGGRVTLFQKQNGGEFKFFTDFQSHEPEFDYLKSLEIEEKINKIKWCKSRQNSQYLLTTNDKTIKLWKVTEKKVKKVWKSPTQTSGLNFPSISVSDSTVNCTARRTYANAHAYHINSISPNSDGDTFISSDDLRINLWNLSITNQSFTVVDIKPANMEDLSEVITSAEFHPSHCNIFVYSSSKGSIKLADMRNAALCDVSAKVFEEQPPPGASKSFFSEIISSISDIKFSADGRYLISRDYLTLKVWDLAMENKPIKTISIHDHIKSKLCDLYENDCIFDKFECAPNATGEFLCTGSYNHHFYVSNLKTGQVYWGEASKKKLPPKLVTAPSMARRTTRGGSLIDVNPDAMDYGKKVLHVAWNPVDKHQVAIAASNNIFLYNGA